MKYIHQLTTTGWHDTLWQSKSCSNQRAIHYKFNIYFISHIQYLLYLDKAILDKMYAKT